jgi:hypothetical protein
MRLSALSTGLTIAVLAGLPMAQAQQATPPIRYQPEVDSPISERNPNGWEQLAEFDFVIGDWDVEITWTPPGGSPTVYGAHWHNHWIINGLTVMQEWRGPFATGAEFRSYNAATQSWEGYNLYPGGPNGWRPTTAQQVGDEMHVVIEGIGPAGEFLNKEIYTDITADSFRMYSEISVDDGESWSTGRYSMIATRVSGDSN